MLSAELMLKVKATFYSVTTTNWTSKVQRCRQSAQVRVEVANEHANGLIHMPASISRRFCGTTQAIDTPIKEAMTMDSAKRMNLELSHQAMLMVKLYLAMSVMRLV